MLKILLTSVLALLAVGSLIWAGIAWQQQQEFLQRATLTQGVLVDADIVETTRNFEAGMTGERSGNQIKQSSLRWYVEFKDQNDTLHRFKTKLSGGDLTMGTAIGVYYLAESPETAEVQHPFAQYGWILILGGVGLIFGGFAIGVWRYL